MRLFLNRYIKFNHKEFGNRNSLQFMSLERNHNDLFINFFVMSIITGYDYKFLIYHGTIFTPPTNLSPHV